MERKGIGRGERIQIFGLYITKEWKVKGACKG